MAKKEAVGLQMEAIYRARLQEAYTQASLTNNWNFIMVFSYRGDLFYIFVAVFMQVFQLKKISEIFV